MMDRRPHVPWKLARIIVKLESIELDITRILVDLIKHLAGYLGKNTFTLMSSDHGGQWPFGKWNLYDDGIRTPLIIKWPDKIQAIKMQWLAG